MTGVRCRSGSSRCKAFGFRVGKLGLGVARLLDDLIPTVLQAVPVFLSRGSSREDFRAYVLALARGAARRGPEATRRERVVMSSPRRVALVILAANLAAAPVAMAQQQPSRQGPSGTAPQGAADEEDMEEEDEEPEPTPSDQTAAAGAAEATPTSTAAVHPDFVRQETEEQAEARRERMLPRYSSLSGAIGLLHVATAEAGSDQTFRFGLIGEYFAANGFLRPLNNPNHPMTPVDPRTMMPVGDDAGHIGATLTLSYSPIRYVDVFASLRSYANRNNTERPSLFQVLGDGNLGVKGIYPVFRGLNLGLSAAVYLLNRTGDIGLGLSSTSADFRLLGTFDVQQLASTVPLRFHLNLGYYLDNSAQLVQDVENARRMRAQGYDPVVCSRPPTTDPTDPRNRNPACHVEISRVERFALGINRADRFNIQVGADARFRIQDAVEFQPFLEWNVGVPVVRTGYICYDASTSPATGVPGDDDKCLAGAGVNAFAASPSYFTLGTRANVVPVRGLSGLLAFDIATGGSGLFVRELAPTPPWMFYFGAAFAHDFTPRLRRVEVPREVVREVPRDVSPMRGAIVGTVTDAESRQPIANAIIEFVGHPDFGLFATDAQGRYRTREVPPGDYELRVRAPDFHENTCRGAVPSPPGQARVAPDTTVDCALRPVARLGNVTGRVVNAQNNQPVAGVTVTLTPGAGITVPQGQTAPTPQNVQTGSDGSFQFQNVLAGQWTLTVSQGPQTRAAPPRTVDVRARETATVDVQVAPVDLRGITVTRTGIQVRESIHFQTDSAEILPDSHTLLERIADVINRHPEIQCLEIQGHTDNQGTPAHNMTLSQQRAEAVRTALINLGVSASRLTARGYGQTRPIAPNITAAGRARNRRVMFVRSTGCQ